MITSDRGKKNDLKKINKDFMNFDGIHSSESVRSNPIDFSFDGNRLYVGSSTGNLEAYGNYRNQQNVLRAASSSQSPDSSSVLDTTLGIIGTIGSLGLGIYDRVKNSQIAAQNYQNQQDEFNFTKEQYADQMDLAKNAVQYRALDLEKAGLSKTLAAGSGATNVSPVNVTAPQNSYVSDISGLIQSVAALMDVVNSSKSTSSQIALNEAMAKDYAAHTAGLSIDNNINSIFGLDSAQSKINYTNQQINNMRQELINLQSNNQLTEVNISKVLIDIGYTEQQTNKIIQETKNLKSENKLKRLNMYLTLQQLRQNEFDYSADKYNFLYYNYNRLPFSHAGTPGVEKGGFSVRGPFGLGFSANGQGYLQGPSGLSDSDLKTSLKEYLNTIDFCPDQVKENIINFNGTSDELREYLENVGFSPISIENILLFKGFVL